MATSLTLLQPFNIDTANTFTFANVTITSNVTSNNANLGNAVTANYFLGNGSQLSGITASTATTAATVTTNAQPNITSTGTLSTLTVTGVITATSGGVKVGNIQDPSGTNTVQLTSGSITVTGNITAGGGGSGNVTATYFIGNGSQLTGLPASYSNTNVAAYLPTYTGNFTAGNANITGNIIAGNVSTSGSGGNITGVNYLIANYFTGTLTTAAQPNITSTGTLASLTVTANITSGNANLGNLVTANFFTGNGYLLTGLPASYSNTNTAAYLPTYTGNFTAGNANVTGNVTATYFIGNGSQLTGLPASYSNTNVAAYLPTYTGNFTAGNANITGNFTAGNANVTGNITAGNLSTSGAGGNITGANYIIANYFSGNGSLLTNITGANITGYAPLATAANTAGTVTTGAQPNITSTGTLVSVTVSGDATITGNLTVSGSYEYANVTSFNVKDPIIEQGGNPNGTPLASNDGKDRGQILHYYSSEAIDGFMGWDNSNAEFAFGSNVSVSSEVVTFNTFGNVRAGYYLGNGSQLTSITGSSVSGNVTNAVQSHYANIANSVAGGNVSGQVSNALIAGTVYTNAQPNITSVGTLTDLTVSNSIVAGGGYGTVTTTQFSSIFAKANGLNATSLIQVKGNDGTNGMGMRAITGGTALIYSNAAIELKVGATIRDLDVPTGGTTIATIDSNGLSVTGNITSTNANLGNLVIANYSTAVLTTGAQPNITSTGTLTSVTVTGNVTAGNIKSDNLLYANGTAWSFSGGGASGVAVGAVQVFTADGSGNTYTLTTTPSNEDQITVNIDGVIQLHSSFSLAGNVVTMSGTPVSGAKVEITNFNSGGAAGSNTQVQFNDGGNIAGTAALTFDKTSNTLNATNITANGAGVATTGKAIAMAIVFGF